MLCETATTKFWRRSRKKSLVKFLRKCYSIHVADYLHVFVIVGELNNTRLQTNLLHFYFLGISRCPIAIASAIWYNKKMILSLDKKSRESGERKDAGLIITTTVASPAFLLLH